MQLLCIPGEEPLLRSINRIGSTTQWQADLAPKEMAASDLRNRRHVQPLLTWSKNAAHPVSLDQEPLQRWMEHGAAAATGQQQPTQRRPDSLILTEEESTEWVHREQQTSASSGDDVAIASQLSADSSLADGCIMVDGDMLAFVADDLQEKIRMSSPPPPPAAVVATPPITLHSAPQVLADITLQAHGLATCIDSLMNKLTESLHSISSITLESLQTFESATCKSCDSIDANIKLMYQVVAKCEELSHSMKPLYKVSDDIKEIKRLLDIFENYVDYKT
ncbi:C17orf59 [Cordylochernes scorpioides]|uniref:C17orf59 n=1 Tax=Cordylochernes scorpioides TaxID=51811 RepID=A0ABY6KZB9_9ARAC|nr:C17orf59 [Cordylochernes scorpioides]